MVEMKRMEAAFIDFSFGLNASMLLYGVGKLRCVKGRDPGQLSWVWKPYLLK